MLKTRWLVAHVLRALPARNALAHCDIPCGIYDPIQAKIAAQTVLKMVLRIEALEKPSADADAGAWAAYENSLTRYILVKEQHAEICKRELDILWHDYFKPEHLEKFPDLHDRFWKATKLASACKQGVNRQSAEQLVQAVDDIARIFWETKGVQYRDEVAQVRFGT